METKKIMHTETRKQTITGSEAIIHCLLAEGVDLIYGYPGGAIMPMYDELYKFQDKLQHVLTRHEQGATHAAQGYARATGKVGVAVATSGPGATNLITGIADAQIDSTPMICITGQVASHLLGSDAFQETDIIGISTPVTKWNYQITKASEIPEVLAKAFYIARSGRPGPVLIDITKDAQFGELDYEYKECTHIRSYKPVPEVKEEALEAAAQLINTAKKPMIVWGQGVILGEAEEASKAQLGKILTINGDKTVLEYHRNLGQIMWDHVGMSRTKDGLTKAVEEISNLKESFWQNVKVPGENNTMNKSLEFAGRVADFIELGELMARDALDREESCGGHFREEHQTPEGEAKRNDDTFSYVAAWEHQQQGPQKLHKEDLAFENVELTQRSYK